MLPETYWGLTPTETRLVLHGARLRDMQAATLIAAFVNVHSRRGQKITPDDVAVFRKRVVTAAQTPEQQKALLEAVTVAMGGGRGDD